MGADPDVFGVALTLPMAERAELAHRLLASLDEHEDDPALTEADWTARSACVSMTSRPGHDRDQLGSGSRAVRPVTAQYRFDPRAVAEFRASRDLYEDANPGLGDDLVDEVWGVIDRVTRWPRLRASTAGAWFERSAPASGARPLPFGSRTSSRATPCGSWRWHTDDGDRGIGATESGEPGSSPPVMASTLRWVDCVPQAVRVPVKIIARPLWDQHRRNRVFHPR